MEGREEFGGRGQGRRKGLYEIRREKGKKERRKCLDSWFNYFCVVCPRTRWRSCAVRCWKCATCSRRRRFTSCRSCGCSWSRPTSRVASCSTASARPSAAASEWLRPDRWTGSWSGALSTTSRSESRVVFLHKLSLPTDCN